MALKKIRVIGTKTQNPNEEKISRLLIGRARLSGSRTNNARLSMSFQIELFPGLIKFPTNSLLSRRRFCKCWKLAAADLSCEIGVSAKDWIGYQG